jgi:hypothetical protein
VIGRVVCVYVRVGRKCVEHLVCVVVMFDAAVVDGGLKWKWNGTRLRPGVNARDSRRELDFIRMRSPRSKFLHEDGKIIRLRRCSYLRGYPKPMWILGLSA